MYPFILRMVLCNKFKYYWESSYIGKISRHLRTRVKEHVPSFVILHINDKKDSKSVTMKNTKIKSAIAEHLVNNTCCANIFDILKLIIMRQFSTTLKVKDWKTSLIQLIKPNL